MSNFHRITRTSSAFNPSLRSQSRPLSVTVVDDPVQQSTGGTTIIYMGGSGGVGGNVSTNWLFTEQQNGSLFLSYKDKVVHAFQGKPSE